MEGGQLSMGGEGPAVCPAVYGGANGEALKGQAVSQLFMGGPSCL
jgi:hypothetical protein